ncbi:MULTISPECIES: hypothetical protein [Sorangium]|uniref:hypothetical protein n=1 Tax=Sorangium TaxID=39643 RepID=UPI003D9C46C3
MADDSSGGAPEHAHVTKRGDPALLLGWRIHAREFSDDVAIRCEIDPARPVSDAR